MSGIVTLYVNLGGGTAPSIEYLNAEVDGESQPGMTTLNKPANSTAAIEVDTAYLADGLHAFRVKACSGLRVDGSGPEMIESAAVTLETANHVTYSKWTGRAQDKVNINLTATASLPQYTLYFFDSSHPKAYGPFTPISSRQGTCAADGTISLSETAASLGFPSGGTGSKIYSVAEQTSGSPGSLPEASATPAILQDPPFPDLGQWVTAYDDSTVDFGRNPYTGMLLPVADTQDLLLGYWAHDNQLGCQPNPLWGTYQHTPGAGWAKCGEWASDGSSETYMLLPPGADQPSYDARVSTLGQTWPVRGSERDSNPVNHLNDVKLLTLFLTLPEVRNFYGSGHGDAGSFMDLVGGPLPQRYRFAFLDGCESYHRPLFEVFGAVADEVPGQNMLDDSNNLMEGCTDQIDELAFYARSGLRPAAFVGSVVLVPFKRTLRSPIYWRTPNGLMRTQVTYPEAIANWHEQFLFFWRGVPGSAPMGLLDAKHEADKWAWKYPSQGGWNGMAPAPPPLSDLEVERGYDGTPNGFPIYFSPVESYKVAGYAWLTFNEYNRATDPLPRRAP